VIGFLRSCFPESLSEKGVTEKFVENVIGPDRFD